MMDPNPLIIASISTAHVRHTYSQDAGRTNNRGYLVLPRGALKPAKHQQQRKALCKCAGVLNARSETNTRPARHLHSVQLQIAANHPMPVLHPPTRSGTFTCIETQTLRPQRRFSTRPPFMRLAAR